MKSSFFIDFLFLPFIIQQSDRMMQLNYPQVRKIKGLIERREGECRLFTQRRQQIGQQNDIPDTP
ncbi:MAG: hypothetical protein ABII96_02960, partial [Candidatus Zixiibacteriota bacterium]